MHEVTVILYDCKPLKAKLSKKACKAAHKMGRKMQFNNDHEGDPFKYEACVGCSGLIGGGEIVSITAAPPRAPRVPVFTIDGGLGYV